MQKIICIYKITNCVNGKIYIGQSIDYNKRKKTHFSKLKSGKHHNEHLQKAYKKYGENAFNIEIVQKCNMLDLDELEKYYIKKFNASDWRYGYNIMGGGQEHRIFTEEQKNKISKALKGRKLTNECKEKISISNKGKKMSKEALEKAIKTKKENDAICFGDKNGNAIISNEKAEQIIKEAYNSKIISVKDLKNKYETTSDIIYNLLYNKSYKNICQEIRIELRQKFMKQKEEKYKYAICMLQQGISQNDISKILNISRNTTRKLMEEINEKRK